MPLLDALHLISDDASLSKEFIGVSTPSKEHWLLPLDRASVEQVDWNAVLAMASGGRIPGFLDAKETGAGKSRKLEIQIIWNGARWEQAYATDLMFNLELGSGNALDVRIWPNYCFPVVPRTPVNPLDRIYYFRIRQQPDWKLSPLVLCRVRNDEGRVIGSELLRPEMGSVLPRQRDRFRQAQFHFLPAEGARCPNGTPCRGHAEPIGLYFENRGLLLFRFYTLPQIGHGLGIPWRAGVDFGTSNTCVAFLTLGSGIEASARVEQFEIQTATMNEFPTYEEVENQG